MNQSSKPAQPGHPSPELEDQDLDRGDSRSPEDVWYAQYKTQGYKELASRMAELKLEIGRLDAKMKALGAEFDVIRLRVVPERFAEDGMTSMRIEGIGRLSLTSDAHCNVLPGAQEELFEFLRSIECGDLIKPTVNPSSLKSVIKDLYKEHISKEVEFDPSSGEIDAEPDEFERACQVVKFTPFTRASVTKG